MDAKHVDIKSIMAELAKHNDVAAIESKMDDRIGPIMEKIEELIRLNLLESLVQTTPEKALQTLDFFEIGGEKLQRIANKTTSVLSPSGWRVSMASPEAEIPAGHVNTDIRNRIEAGDIGIWELCNETDVGLKRVDESFAEEESCMNRLFLSKQYAKGSSPVVFYSRLRDCCASRICGDERNSFKFADVWNMTSPPFQRRTDPTTGEPFPGAVFSLPQAVLSFRSYGAPKLEPGQYLHWSCPTNDPGAKGVDISKCGAGWGTAESLARAWNSAIWVASGSPDPTTTEYKHLMQDSAFTPEEVYETMECLALIFNKDPKGAAEQMELCFSNLPQSQHEGKHPNTAKLYKHISTIHSKESLSTQLELLHSKNKGEWSDEQHYAEIISSSTQSPHVQFDQDKLTCKPNITMIRPEVFKWATQRDLVIVNKGTEDETCYTASGAYVQGRKKTVRSSFGYKKSLQARAARIQERKSRDRNNVANEGEWVHPKGNRNREHKGKGGKGKSNRAGSTEAAHHTANETALDFGGCYAK